jgi:serine/threonine protein kinase
MMTVLPSTDFGAFEVVGALGQGGMAEVWQAMQRLPTGRCRPVALKRMRARLLGDASALRMFRAEARLSTLLQHPNIVRVLDSGELNGQPFIAFELIDGLELRRLFRERRTPLPLGFTVSLVRTIADALAYAHRLVDENGEWLRLVHRDVSPSNVMIALDGTFKLLDFGVARARRDDGSETTFGVAKGKVGYMAPEVVAGRPLDERVDLFSLGVVLHELLTHRRLFSDKDQKVALLLNRTARATPPSLVNPEVPAILDQITLRALQRDPDARFQTAREMSDALATVQAELPWSKEDTRGLLTEHMPRTVELAVEPCTDGVEHGEPAQYVGELRTTVRESSSGRAVQVSAGAQVPAVSVSARLSDAATEPARLQPPAQPQPKPSLLQLLQRLQPPRSVRSRVVLAALGATSIAAIIIAWPRGGDVDDVVAQPVPASSALATLPSTEVATPPSPAPTAATVSSTAGTVSPTAATVTPPPVRVTALPPPPAAMVSPTAATPSAWPSPPRTHSHQHSSSRVHAPAAPSFNGTRLYNPFGRSP